MRPDMVVVFPPTINDGSGVLQTGEPVQIQAVVPELAVEALDKGVLRRLTRLNEVKLHTSLPGPEKHCLACKFRAVVTDQGLG